MDRNMCSDSFVSPEICFGWNKEVFRLINRFERGVAKNIIHWIVASLSTQTQLFKAMKFKFLTFNLENIRRILLGVKAKSSFQNFVTNIILFSFINVEEFKIMTIYCHLSLSILMIENILTNTSQNLHHFNANEFQISIFEKQVHFRRFCCRQKFIFRPLNILIVSFKFIDTNVFKTYKFRLVWRKISNRK